MSATSGSDATRPPSSASEAGPEVLILDPDTRADLQLFGSDSEPSSLFEFCDRCRTEGGKRALRRRMEHPWSSADRIRATQDALSFILGHRQAFAELPAAYVTINVERYIGAGLPMVRQISILEFTLGAISLRANEDHFYTKIRHGVELTCRLLSTLRQLVYEIDALVSMAEVTEEHGFVLPQLDAGPVRLDAVGLVHLTFRTLAWAYPRKGFTSSRYSALSRQSRSGTT